MIPDQLKISLDAFSTALIRGLDERSTQLLDFMAQSIFDLVIAQRAQLVFFSDMLEQTSGVASEEIRLRFDNFLRSEKDRILLDLEKTDPDQAAKLCSRPIDGENDTTPPTK